MRIRFIIALVAVLALIPATAQPCTWILWMDCIEECQDCFQTCYSDCRWLGGHPPSVCSRSCEFSYAICEQDCNDHWPLCGE